jgi:hypothetical protein
VHASIAAQTRTQATDIITSVQDIIRSATFSDEIYSIIDCSFSESGVLSGEVDLAVVVSTLSGADILCQVDDISLARSTHYRMDLPPLKSLSASTSFLES